MSVAFFSVGEGPLAGQEEASSKKTPPKRQVVAKADATLQAEAR